MSQNIDVSIARLSAPVEALEIDRRACRCLKRAGFCTVAEVLLAGEPKLNAAKNIGSLTVKRVLQAVAGFLGLPEDQVTVQSLGEQPSLLEDSTIYTLPLAASIIWALEQLGIVRIQDLMKARAEHYNTLLGLDVRQIHEIDQVLRDYLAWMARAYLLPILGTEAILANPFWEARPAMGLYAILHSDGLDERAWSILEARAMQCLSRPELKIRNRDKSEGRLREIIRHVPEHLRRRLSLLCPFLDHFEERSKELQASLGQEPLDRKTLTRQLASETLPGGLAVSEGEVEQTIIMIRNLALSLDGWFLKEMAPCWHSFALLSCLVEPVLTRYEPVRQLLRERKPPQKGKVRTELARTVLAQAGKPLHWREIVERARRLDPQAYVHLRRIHEVLLQHHELFARIDQGTYALVEWGYQTVETYSAIIAAVLTQENKPMPLEAIFERVSAIRPILRNTLYTHLTCHPRFYRSVRDTYGLRSWLLSQERQSAFAPDELIETPISLKRVERARGHRMIERYLV